MDNEFKMQLKELLNKDNQLSVSLNYFIDNSDEKMLLDTFLIGYKSIELSKKILDKPIEENKSSVLIGKLGEKTIKAIILEKYELIEVTKKKYSGDFVIFHDEFKIVVESKKYNKPVPSKEIDKFKRDVSMSSYHGGLLISLSSSIAKYNSPINLTYEIVDGKKIPMILISDINLIHPCIEILLSLLKNENEHIVIKSNIEKSLLSIENATKIFEDLQIYNLRQHNLITKDFANIISNLKENIT